MFKLLHNCTHSLAAGTAKSLQLCATLCDPMDGSPPGFSVHGILQARTLEWVAISFSNAWKWKVKVKLLSRVWLLATPWTAAYQDPPSMDFPGKSTGVGCHCLLPTHSLAKYYSKFSKPGFNSTWTMNFQMSKLVLEKAEEPENNLPTSVRS